MHFDERYFFYQLKSLRFFGKSVPYQRDIKVLTAPGMGLIAYYYNNKYFKDSNKKIVLTTSIADMKSKIEEVITSPLLCVGFVYLDEHVEEKISHSVPLILEKTEDQTYLYVCDSIAGSGGIATQLVAFCQKLGIVICINAYMRQADRGSCKSESLVYLKNALQQESIKNNVQMFSTDEALSYLQTVEPDFPDTEEFLQNNPSNTVLFLESPDMLKSAQRGDALTRNRIHVDARLQSTKVGATYSQKLDPYHGETPYRKVDVSKGDSPGVMGFKERLYMLKKVQSHFEKVQSMVENAPSMDAIQQMIQTAFTLKS